MSHSITQRHHLTLRQSADIPELVRDIDTWANRLPFGPCGFQVTGTAGTVVASGGATPVPVSFDVTDDDTDNFVSLASGAIFTIPPECGGTYIATFNGFGPPAGPFTTGRMAIRHNNLVVAEYPFTGPNRKFTLTAIIPLVVPGDLLEAVYAQNEGVSMTFQSFAASSGAAASPRFSAYRMGVSK